MDSGVAISILPRIGIQSLAELPSEGIWYSSGDEWGGAPRYLRGLIVRDLLVASGALTLLLWTEERFPSCSRWLAGFAIGLVLVIISLRAFTLGMANWGADVFLIVGSFWPSSPEPIISPTWNEWSGGLRVTRSAYEVRESLLRWFFAATLVGIGLIALRIRRMVMRTPSHREASSPGETLSIADL
jgi:hypothetical protein